MSTQRFDDYLSQLEQDPTRRAHIEAAYAGFVSAVAVSAARKDAKLTQRQLAERAHVPQSTIARIERGENTSMETLSKLATAMGKKLDVVIR
ncbi:helix-turn-helix domain-containing protein [Schleiferilactobacillus shenzhenensis]|uniref:HTH cro/C1-type domain-containing protein n=1 Tax=Schleiferilactobacillus shenzhenensis LY-73 TaxID=1231336 RepID=U4TJ39_9LACO|nr:helix-turn-helix transcriptional regulator [Schleiferilactobacillus shenzhenensis]ERL64229.1 hypothetical protein L248_1507 [Schleiferilactobacillus shenzhenensis LY-73]